MNSSRLLIAEDDAAWLRVLQAERYFHEVCIVDNLAEALQMIDDPAGWDAGLFDLLLREGDTPFETSTLARDAGIILAAAFLDSYPGHRVAVTTGFGLEVMPHRHLVNSDSIRFISKAAYMLSMPDYAKQLPYEKRRLYFGGLYQSPLDLMDFLATGKSLNPSPRHPLDYLLLQPNFCGLGINLRTLIDDLRDYFRRKKAPQSDESEEARRALETLQGAETSNDSEPEES